MEPTAASKTAQTIAVVTEPAKKVAVYAATDTLVPHATSLAAATTAPTPMATVSTVNVSVFLDGPEATAKTLSVLILPAEAMVFAITVIAYACLVGLEPIAPKRAVSMIAVFTEPVWLTLATVTLVGEETTAR